MITPEMIDFLIKTFADGNQRKFSKMLDLNNAQSITDWKKRGLNRLEQVEKIYSLFGDRLSAEWLITGLGEPLKQNADFSTAGNDTMREDGCASRALVAQLNEKDRQIADLHQIIINLTSRG